MPQMYAVQPVTPQASPQAPPAEKPSKKEQTQFSPHLEKALSSKKTPKAAEHDKSSKSQAPAKNEQESLDASSNDSLTAHQDAATSEALEDSSDTGAEENLAGIFPSTPHTDSTRLFASSTFSKTHQFTMATSQPQNQSSEIINTLNIAGEDLGNWEILPKESGEIMASPKPQPDLAKTTAPIILKSTYPVSGNRQDPLVSQLQQIIDNANETGTVSITHAGNSSSHTVLERGILGDTTASFSSNSITATTTTATSELHLNGLVIGDFESIHKSVDKPTQQLTGTRQDIQQQYYNAKITSQNLAENQQNFGDSQQGDDFNQQTSGFGFQNGPWSISEQTNTFSQISAIVQNTPAQPTAEVTTQIILPSGMVVHEDEIIQQLTERFQISSKQTDSRINLKLHPAELGELKINLSVKEGTIRANVVAQSQHTMEILEKNIPKLKTVLENQGFTVDQISVTAESDSVGSFDLFDQQFFGQNDNPPAPQHSHRRNEDAFVLDVNEYLPPAENAGVNVKI